jgi:uncharacterized protein (DUF2267 family)
MTRRLLSQWFDDPALRADDPAADAASVEFLAGLERSGGLPPGVSAVDATLAVLCPLLLRVSLGTARRALAALPPALRALVERGTGPHTGSPLLFDDEQFLRMIRYRLPDVSTEQADEMVRVVFQAFRALLPPRAQREIASQLPKALRMFWPAERRAG